MSVGLNIGRLTPIFKVLDSLNVSVNKYLNYYVFKIFKEQHIKGSIFDVKALAPWLLNRGGWWIPKLKQEQILFLLLSRHFSTQIHEVYTVYAYFIKAILSSKPKNKKAKNKKITTTTGKKDSQILSNKNI